MGVERGSKEYNEIKSFVEEVYGQLKRSKIITDIEIVDNEKGNRDIHGYGLFEKKYMIKRYKTIENIDKDGTKVFVCYYPYLHTQAYWINQKGDVIISTNARISKYSNSERIIIPLDGTFQKGFKNPEDATNSIEKGILEVLGELEKKNNKYKSV